MVLSYFKWRKIHQLEADTQWYYPISTKGRYISWRQIHSGTILFQPKADTSDEGRYTVGTSWCPLCIIISVYKVVGALYYFNWRQIHPMKADTQWPYPISTGGRYISWRQTRRQWQSCRYIRWRQIHSGPILFQLKADTSVEGRHADSGNPI